MGPRTAELRRQIEQSREALDAKFAFLQQRPPQLTAAILEQTILAPVRSMQESST